MDKKFGQGPPPLPSFGQNSKEQLLFFGRPSLSITTWVLSFGKEKKGSEVLKQMCQPRLDLHLNRELEFAKGGQGHHTKVHKSK